MACVPTYLTVWALDKHTVPHNFLEPFETRPETSLSRNKMNAATPEDMNREHIIDGFYEAEI